MALHQKKIYTIDDIYALPEGQRAELIDERRILKNKSKRISERCEIIREEYYEDQI